MVSMPSSFKNSNISDSLIYSKVNHILPTRAKCAGITAADHFQLISTINLGGNYGKNELSPALRDQFVIICIQSISGDIPQIAHAKIALLRPYYSIPIVEFRCCFPKALTPLHLL